jgi:hypothetical protein
MYYSEMISKLYDAIAWTEHIYKEKDLNTQFAHPTLFINHFFHHQTFSKHQPSPTSFQTQPKSQSCLHTLSQEPIEDSE